MLKTLVKKLLYTGTNRFCPVCERSARKFRTYGYIPRLDARCPWCGALERHRFVFYYLKHQTDLFSRKARRLLHIAPEKTLGKLIADAVGDGYLSADLVDPFAMVKMDITDIQYPDASFDIIYCSHVLEHVPDDRKAMSEFFRVLAPGGWAILNVPITAEQTIEDPDEKDPAERLRRFGQADHVRRYGPDYIDRLREAGFDVKVFEPKDIVPTDKAGLYGLEGSVDNYLYHCFKP